MPLERHKPRDTIPIRKGISFETDTSVYNKSFQNSRPTTAKPPKHVRSHVRSKTQVEATGSRIFPSAEFR